VLDPTAAQSLRAFPQFTAMNSIGSPRGRTWYDLLLVRGNQASPLGLGFTSVFTRPKGLRVGTER
jgi:hypothetical protein